jgi:hypothetical protein
VQYPTELLEAKSEADIDAYVAKGGDVMDMYRFVEHNPKFAVASLMKTWLRRQEERQAQVKLDLERRSVNAAEQSAKHARHSAWAASIAVGVSLVALAVAIVALAKL